MINLSKSGISTDTFDYGTRRVVVTAPKSIVMDEVRDLYEMGVLGYHSLMLNLERVPGANIQVRDV
jgi:hypothetical protein